MDTLIFKNIFRAIIPKNVTMENQNLISSSLKTLDAQLVASADQRDDSKMAIFLVQKAIREKFGGGAMKLFNKDDDQTAKLAFLVKGYWIAPGMLIKKTLTLFKFLEFSS